MRSRSMAASWSIVSPVPDETITAAPGLVEVLEFPSSFSIRLYFNWFRRRSTTATGIALRRASRSFGVRHCKNISANISPCRPSVATRGRRRARETRRHRHRHPSTREFSIVSGKSHRDGYSSDALTAAIFLDKFCGHFHAVGVGYSNMPGHSLVFVKVPRWIVHRRQVLLLLALACATAITYANSLSNG